MKEANEVNSDFITNVEVYMIVILISATILSLLIIAIAAACEWMITRNIRSVN